MHLVNNYLVLYIHNKTGKNIVCKTNSLGIRPQHEWDEF